MNRKIYLIARNFAAQMKKENISAFASSTAFFIFLSLLPMLIMVCTIIPFTPLTEENLVLAVTAFTPDMLDAFVESLIAEVYEKSAGILSIAIIATIWSAGKGVLALMRGLNAINDVEEERNYFVVRAISSFYTVIMLAIIVISLVIMVFGNQLVDMILFHVPQLQVVVVFIGNMRFIIVWVVLILLFAMIYTYVPDRKMRFSEQIPGATFTAVAWSVLSWGISMYVTYYEMSTVYGTLSVIIVILLWMYLGMYAVMVGAYINRYFQPVNEVIFKKR